MSIIISASSVPTSLMCMAKAAQGFFGARASMDSEFRDAMEANGHAHYRPFVQGVAAKIGTASHKGCELSLKEKAGGEKPRIDDSIQATLESLRDKSEEIEFDSKITNIVRAEDSAVKNIRIFHKRAIESIDPKKVELRYSKEIGGGFVLTAQIDVVEYDGSPLDHKFGVMSAAGYTAQIGSAFLVSDDATGERGRILKINNAPRELYEETAIKRADAKALALQQIKKIMQQVKKYMDTGNPDSFDFNPGCMLCSEKYCNAFGTNFCRYTKQ